MAEDLDTPLKASPEKSARMPRVLLSAVTLAMAAALAGVVALVFMRDDPLGGEPRQIVKIDPIPALAKKNADAQPRQDEQKGDQRTITIIDGNTGARREIVINDSKSDAPPAATPPAKSAPRTPQSQITSAIPQADKRLIETTKHGLIPKIGADGSRPLEVYASPIPVAAGADSMIAIVITGLGVSAANTGEAIAKLPPAITLGFAPYGSELTQWITKARGSGREVLLQIPMEPFDYPDNDPGPQTLTANANKDQNIDRLHFFLSRTQGYVGVTNLMGARFTANEDAIAAILAETGKRGLLFIDDGSSPRSAAQRAADKTKSPFLRADLVIDARTEWADIDAALVKLEAIASQRGVAIATASALPVTIDRIARWAKTLEARGIRLVPVSTAFQRLAKQS